MQVTMGQFEEAVRTAVDSVPEPFQGYLNDIEFVVAESSTGRNLLGLYQGAGALVEGGLPARSTLYRDTHATVSDNREELVAEVRRTVLHEIGHHFAMGEEELRRSGL
jgi:predicted Zn-dependent protease with MMP-like domain